MMQGLSKKTLLLFVGLTVAAYSTSDATFNTTCFDLKEAYQLSSCCNSTTTRAATFDKLDSALDLTCGDLSSSYKGSSCCSAELSNVATMTIQEPSSAPSSEPSSMPSSEPSIMPSSAPSCADDDACLQAKPGWSLQNTCASAEGFCQGLPGPQADMEECCRQTC